MACSFGRYFFQVWAYFWPDFGWYWQSTAQVIVILTFFLANFKLIYNVDLGPINQLLWYFGICDTRFISCLVVIQFVKNWICPPHQFYKVAAIKSPADSSKFFYCYFSKIYLLVSGQTTFLALIKTFSSFLITTKLIFVNS